MKVDCWDVGDYSGGMDSCLRRNNGSTCLMDSLEDVYLLAEVLGDSQFVEFHGGGDVLDGEALGLEEGDLGVGCAAGSFAGDHVSEFGNGLPVYGAPFGGDEEVAAFDLSLFSGVDGDDIGLADGVVV